MIDSTENFQTVFALVLLYLQAVLDDLTAVLHIEAAGLDFVLFAADSLDDLVGDILDVSVRLMVN